MDQASRLAFTQEVRKKYPERPYVNVHRVPPWVEIGERVSIHSGVTFSQGFGFGWTESGEYLHIPHIGKIIIEDDVEIFEGTNIARATVDNTVIGRGSKIDALCHIAHNVFIGKNCFITAGVIIAGSAVLGHGVYVGINSSIRDHVSIAPQVFIGQGSNVVKSIPEANSVWAGNPARFVRWRRGNEM